VKLVPLASYLAIQAVANLVDCWNSLETAVPLAKKMCRLNSNRIVESCFLPILASCQGAKTCLQYSAEKNLYASETF